MRSQLPVLAALVASIVLVPGVSHAQAAPAARRYFISGTAGYTSAEPKGGFAANVGVAAVTRRFFGYLVPADITFIPKRQSTQYVIETFYGGQQACVERSTGRYVSNSKCSTTPTMKYAAAAEANYAFVGTASSVFAGAGYRAGFSPTPYGIIGFIGRIPNGPPATAKLSVGDQFWQIGVTAHF